MHLRDVAGGAGFIGGPGHAQGVVGLEEFLLVAVGQCPPFLLADSVRPLLEAGLEGLGGFGEDLVVDVRDIADGGDAQAAVLKPAGELVEGDGGPDVAHMRHALHRGAAVVQAHLSRDEGNEVADFGGCGVVKTEGHRSRLADPARLPGIHQSGGNGGNAFAAAGETQPVAGGGGDADGGTAAALRTSCDSCRRGPNLGRLATNCTATLPISNPAARTILAASARSVTPDAPANSGRSVPKWVPRSPMPAAENSASAAAWATGSPSECPASPRSPSHKQPAQPQRTGVPLRGVGVDVHADARARQDHRCFFHAQPSTHGCRAGLPAGPRQ